MIWLIAMLLIMIAGLNAPLAVCALSLAAFTGMIELRPEWIWLASPWVLSGALSLLVLQLLADLYFVPVTVRDYAYLHPNRTHNNYLHARLQSFLRPMVAALVCAALVLPLADWLAATLAFTLATACYWLTAWIREYVAITRGALVLLVLETIKNALLIVLSLLIFWLPLLALGLLFAMVMPTIAWTLRLQRERLLYDTPGGQRASEDARIVRSE
jgi:hypothetical protein